MEDGKGQSRGWERVVVGWVAPQPFRLALLDPWIVDHVFFKSGVNSNLVVQEIHSPSRVGYSKDWSRYQQRLLESDQVSSRG